MDIVAPQITVEGDFPAVVGSSYEGALEAGPQSLAMLYLRHGRVASLAISTAAIFILFGGFRTAQPWAWWALLVGLLIPVKRFFAGKA